MKFATFAVGIAATFSSLALVAPAELNPRIICIGCTNTDGTTGQCEDKAGDGQVCVYAVNCRCCDWNEETQEIIGECRNAD